MSGGMEEEQEEEEEQEPKQELLSLQALLSRVRWCAAGKKLFLSSWGVWVFKKAFDVAWGAQRGGRFDAAIPCERVPPLPLLQLHSAAAARLCFQAGLRSSRRGEGASS